MVGLVIVSHSQKLAKATSELIAATTTSPIPMAIAGGVGENHDEFGTDAIEIMEAIQSVYSADGVVVLVDLGSAVLSAETALELLGEEQSRMIKICPAALVEGSVSAAAQIAISAPLDQVISEALSALVPKQEHLNGVYRSATSSEQNENRQERTTFPIQTSETPSVENREERFLTVRNLHGLHARPAFRFVQTAGQFSSDVTVKNVTRNTGFVSGKSMNKLSTLGIREGDLILVTTAGTDASGAISAIERLAEANFGDDTANNSTIADKTGISSRPNGVVGISDGIAVGPARHLRAQDFFVKPREIDDVVSEIGKFKNAVKNVSAEIEKRVARLKGTLSTSDLDIFLAHKAILNDPGLQEDVENRIRQENICAEYAWSKGIDEVKREYDELEDEYLKSRAADVQDVKNQLLAFLLENGPSTVAFDEPTILFAEDLNPSEAITLNAANVVGIVTTLGGPTTHAAIIAKSLGIPYVAGYDDLSKIRDGQIVAIDGFEGRIVIEPPAEVYDQYIERRDVWKKKKSDLLQKALRPAITQDGIPFPVFANIGSPEEALAAANAGADGVGLLRSEFLFLDRQTPPTEEEQFETLCKIGRILEKKPIVVRTLDIGGDKELPYLSIEHEDNPFLGVRAVRLYQRIEPLITTHLRAILRAANDFDFRIMIPMIAQVQELRMMLVWLERIHETLKESGIKHRWPITTGIMVETPSAVQLSDHLAKNAGFFSIGTNDLTQYTMAAERGNPSLLEYADPLHPSILRSIGRTVETAHQAGIEVAVCGEVASDNFAVPLLLGLGIDEVSLSPAKIPEIKDHLRTTRFDRAKKVAEKVLLLDSANSVREMLRNSNL